MSSKLEQIGRRYVPPAAAKYGKILVAHPRYWQQWRQGQKNYHAYGDRYEQSILFIAGLPKSGTTWLESMLSSIPGFTNLMLPEAVTYEHRKRESHTFQLREDTFQRLKGIQVVLKLHLNGTDHNFRLLRRAGLRWVVIFRDLRDVAVSYVHYVRRTTYHPDHRFYAALSVQDGLHRFAEEWLPDYARWVQSWTKKAKGTDDGLIITYESLREQPEHTFRLVCNHYRLNQAEEEIRSIVAAHSFERKAEADGFYRKGISGDWKNHFNRELSLKFQAIIGEFLLEHQYEQDDQWILP